MLEEPTLAPAHAAQDDPAEPAAFPWRSLLVLLGTVLLTLGLVLVPADLVAGLGAYGYLGVFLLTMLASASIVLPSPALGVAILAGRSLNPWLVGTVAGVAAGLGEITGYMAGLGGSSVVMRSRFYPRVAGWVRRWGLLTIFVLAVIPGPMFDLAGIAAGTMRVPFRRFLVACLAGKVLRFIAVAWAGHLLGGSEGFENR